MNGSANCRFWLATQYYALHYLITSIIRARFIIRRQGDAARRLAARKNLRYIYGCLQTGLSRPSSNKVQLKDSGDAQAESSYSGSGLSIFSDQHSTASGSERVI